MKDPIMRLSDALIDISELLGAIEDLDGEEIPDTLIPRWNTAVENLKQAVDTRAFQLRQVKAMQDSLDMMIKGLQQKKKNFARYEERLLSYTKAVLEQNPELELRGDVSSFILCKNSVCTINYHVTFQKPPVLVDPFDVYKFPAEFITQGQFFVLDKESFEAALRRGEVTCEAAELGERGTHVRFK